MIEKTSYAGWTDCWKLHDGHLEVVVVADVGPRIIDVRLAGGENLFFHVPSQLGKAAEPHYQVRGGWRLWVAPEHDATTCHRDRPGRHRATRRRGRLGRGALQILGRYVEQT